jgi:hypothetical protein
MCIVACPYENVIYFNDSLNIAQKCTFCAHLLDKGWKEPRCVDACPTGAFTFGEETDPKIKALASRAQPLRPDLNVKPRVYYIGLPTKFIAGAAYDPDEDECLEGATVTVSNLGTGEKSTAKTDIYGDFWFENIQADQTYSLRIEKDEYYPQEMHDINTAKDVNVGDIKLHKKAKVPES